MPWNMKWTQQQEELIAKLWQQDMTASEIGDAVGRTKGQVLGKLRRLGLTGNGVGRGGGRNNRRGRPRKGAAALQEAVQEQKRPDPPVLPQKRVSGSQNQKRTSKITHFVGQRQNFRTCQFIADEPLPIEDCKCGKPTEGGSPWCIEHLQIVYRDAAEFEAEVEAVMERQGI